MPASVAGGLTAPGLQDCPDCRADMVSPIEWHPVDDHLWSMRLRCGQCGTARDVVATNAEAADYDGELDRQRAAIQRMLDATVRQGLAEEADRFAEALRRDLIDASDFGRTA